MYHNEKMRYRYYRDKSIEIQEKTGINEAQKNSKVQNKSTEADTPPDSNENPTFFVSKPYNTGLFLFT